MRANGTKHGLSVLILAFFVFLAIASATTPDTVQEPLQESGFYYEKTSNNTIEIRRYRGTGRNVVIPETIRGLPVTSIGARAFEGNQLTGVTIPNSVTSIGEEAFAGNQLTGVAIPGSVTSIGASAFANNQLTGVTIPDSVTYIGSRAFADNQLTSLTIPDSVTSIGNSAFAGNQLTSLTIPESVTYIGSRAFAGNQLTVVTGVPGWNWRASLKGKNIFDGNAGDPFVILTDNTTATIIGYDSDNKTVVIPERIRNLPVTGIGSRAFEDEGLYSVVISGSVTSIGWAAFAGNKLTRVTIPNSVTAIASYAFYDSGIGGITLPKSVTFVGEGAFDRHVSVSQE
ncbi:MAG: leucine-rich repeat domain-containing protein [Treponema sp.]|jgi:hypothetical protein|nr:leucine-rich repeat domain-containing protein [Treponema sp.]